MGYEKGGRGDRFFDRGDHLKVNRYFGAYTHHGIYIGGNKVIHYSGLSVGTNLDGVVELVSLDDFANGSDIDVIYNDFSKYSRAEVVQRAKSRLGEDKYSVTGNNCEHFCNWCSSGDHHSEQVIDKSLGRIDSRSKDSALLHLTDEEINEIDWYIWEKICDLDVLRTSAKVASAKIQFLMLHVKNID